MLITGRYARVLFGLSLAVGVWGLAGTPQVRAQELALGPKVTPPAMFADQLLLLAWQTVSGGGDPRPDQLTRAQILMDLALRLDSDRAETWLLRAELGKLIKDKAAQRRALSQYLKLRPDDDAAYLSLTKMVVEEMQTLEQRIDSVERLLNSASGQNLSKSLRSRLASYVAANARELGDQQRHVQYLDMARKLDPANQEAAALMYELMLSRSMPPAVMGAAVMQMVRAAPFDGSARRLLAQSLLVQGAYAQAAEQFDVARLAGPLGRDAQLCYQWALSLAASGQVESALELLGAYEASLNLPEPSTSEPAPAEEAAQEKPAAVPLPVDLELMRLAILHQAGYASRAEGAFGRIRRELIQRMSDGDEQARMDLAWIAVLFNQAGEERERWMADLAKTRDVKDPLLLRAQGFAALGKGHLDSARQILDPLAERDPFARYGRALCQTDSGRREQKITDLKQVISQGYDSLAALLAAGALLDLATPVTPSDTGRQLVAMYDQWPGMLRKPDLQVLPWASLRVEVQPPISRYLDPITAEVELSNRSEISVSLGREGTLPTSVLLFVAPDRAGQRVDLPPIVVDMHRRLTLEAGESVRVSLRLDRDAFGSLLAVNPVERMGFSVSAYLDPRPTGRGFLGVGPLGTILRLRALERRGLISTAANIEDWIVGLKDPDPIERLKCLARLVQMSLHLGDSEEARKLTARVAEAVNERYPQLDPLEQAWTARFLPSGEESGRLFGRVHESAQRSDDPATRIAYLYTQVQAADSPILTSALRHANPDIARFAEALRVGIEQDQAAKAAAQAEQAQPK